MVDGHKNRDRSKKQVPKNLPSNNNFPVKTADMQFAISYDCLLWLQTCVSGIMHKYKSGPIFFGNNFAVSWAKNTKERKRHKCNTAIKNSRSSKSERKKMHYPQWSSTNCHGYRNHHETGLLWLSLRWSGFASFALKQKKKWMQVGGGNFACLAVVSLVWGESNNDKKYWQSWS